MSELYRMHFRVCEQLHLVRALRYKAGLMLFSDLEQTVMRLRDRWVSRGKFPDLYLYFSLESGLNISLRLNWVNCRFVRLCSLVDQSQCYCLSGRGHNKMSCG